MEKHLVQLEDLLRRELAEHQRLLELLRAKHDALRKADRQRIVDLCREENKAVQALGELEKRRLTIAAELTRMLDTEAARPMTVAEIAQRLPEPVRGKLLVLRMELRARMTQVRETGGVARRAAEALLTHMQGLVQKVGQAMSGHSTYSPAGNPPRATLAVSTFSMSA